MRESGWNCSCGYRWTDEYINCPKCGARCPNANYVQVSTNASGTDGSHCTQCSKAFELTESRYYIHGSILCGSCYRSNLTYPVYYGNDPNCYGYVVPKGWECPRCHKIWSPTTPACYACNGKALPVFLYSNFYDLGPEKICKMFGWDYDRVKEECGAMFAKDEEKK